MQRIPLILLIISFFGISCQKDNSRSGPAATPPSRSYTDVAYGADPLQKMDVYLPAGRTADSTVLLVLIHGGAWMEGDKHDFDSIVLLLKQRLPHDAIANINYRLATQISNHFPVQEEDATAAIRFLEQQDSSYQISHKIIVMGASAGAHLALLEAYKHNDGNVRGVVDFFGPTDLADMYNTATDSTVKWGLALLLNGTSSSNAMLYQQSSPINFVSAQSPPTFIVHGGMDTLVHTDQSTALKSKLQAVNVPVEMVVYPNEGHGWGGPDLLDAINRSVAFIKANVH